MNPFVMEILLQEKRREMLVEAERSRLIAEYVGTKPKFKEKVLTKLGERLITIGEKLTHRYDHKFEMPTSR